MGLSVCYSPGYECCRIGMLIEFYYFQAYVMFCTHCPHFLWASSVEYSDHHEFVEFRVGVACLVYFVRCSV